MIKRPGHSEHVDSNWIAAVDAFGRTTKITVATLAATAALFADASEAPSTKTSSASAATEQQECYALPLDDGDTMEQAFYTFSGVFPASESLDAFKEYSIDRSIGPSTPLPKSVLTICLSPEGTVATITSNPPVIGSTAASSN